jgi:hypothetical protein
MFTKNQIDNWIDLYQLSDNKNDFLQDSFNERVFLKRDLVEAKVQIDRWGTVTNVWIFHSSKKDMIHSLFPEDEAIYKDSDAESLKAALRVLVKYASVLELGIDLKDRSINDLTPEELVKMATLSDCKKTYHIWGADVCFTDDIDPNTAIGLSLNPDELTLMPNDSNNLTNSIIVFNVP